ncbi:MAG: hypothetical protein QOK43_1973 [Acidimicrobiaceae bacterium]|nr:hypothetical protein [Acidimicrobiaceae bacterium]
MNAIVRALALLLAAAVAIHVAAGLVAQAIGPLTVLLVLASVIVWLLKPQGRFPFR